MPIDDLVAAIARDIGYSLPLHGEVAEWDKHAILYSAVARVSLCSVWDGEGNEDGQQTVEHFKGKLVESLYAYAVSVPSFKRALGFDTAVRLREAAEEFFQVYWQTGNIYRCSSEKAHRVMAVPQRCADCEGVSFLRGVLPGQAVRMSGAGCYGKGETGVIENACAFFGFGEPVGGRLLETVARSLEWKPFPKVEHVEYLNTAIGPGRKSYWDPSYCDKDGLLSLARYGQKGAETYVMYRVSESGTVKMATLPGWRCSHPWGDDVEAGYTTKEYLRLAASALSVRGRLPAIEYSANSRCVRVRLGYLLPVSEENFLRLYSWPVNFSHFGLPVKIGNENFDQQIHRVMTNEVFRSFRGMLEHQGYAFRESKEI